jgi:hypothetical protein
MLDQDNLTSVQVKNLEKVEMYISICTTLL